MANDFACISKVSRCLLSACIHDSQIHRLFISTLQEELLLIAFEATGADFPHIPASAAGMHAAEVGRDRGDARYA